MMPLVTFLCGAVFAAGLGLSGMTDATQVQGFLDFTGDWNPRLMVVLGVAAPVYGLLYAFARRLHRPLLSGRFATPSLRDIDARLCIGAIIFGAGWGLAGLCPAPALVNLASGEPGMLLFVASMLPGLAYRVRGQVAG